MKQRLHIALLLAAVALVYGNSLPLEFTMDDKVYIVNNPQVTDLSVRELFSANKFSNVYRPLTFATFDLNWAINGTRPLGFHLLNLMLHAGVTWLLYMLLQTILGPSPQGNASALAAALLFAVHPIHTEAVTSIVGRAELLAAGFLLAAWILHLRDKEIPALICFALALLSKESAVVFLALVLVGDYARGNWKQHLRYVRIGGGTLLYLGLLWKVQGGHFGPAGISPLDNPLASIPSGWRILNAVRVAWKYAGLHFYPGTLSCDYSFSQIPVYFDWRHTLPAAVAAFAVIGAWVWAIQKRHSGLVLAGGIYLAGFAITANILVPIGTSMAERLAYFPSAGFCLLVALSWSRLKNRQRTLALGLLVSLLAALAIRTVARNRDWENDLILYSAAVRAAPGSAKMHAFLGREYMAQGLLEPARIEFLNALRIYPDYPDALAPYGLLESWRGNYDAAVQMTAKALSMSGRNNPNYDFMAVNLAGLWMQTGRMDDALDLLNRETAESPAYARAWANRAVIHYKRGETASARADLQVALRLDPGNTQAQNLMRLLNTSTPPAFQR